MRVGHALAGLGFAVLIAAAPAPPTPSAPPPAKPGLSALTGLQPGLWRLRMIGSQEPERDICVADARLLMQIRHGAAPCDGLVVANEARLATLHYSCRAAGWGRTSLRLEDGGRVHIDSQGIAENAPFAFVAEARRTGDCASPAAVPAPASAPSNPR